MAAIDQEMLEVIEEVKKVMYARDIYEEALKAMMKAWKQDKPRSMHDLKTDMDAAYEKGRKAMDEV